MFSINKFLKASTQSGATPSLVPPPPKSTTAPSTQPDSTEERTLYGKKKRPQWIAPDHQQSAPLPDSGTPASTISPKGHANPTPAIEMPVDKARSHSSVVGLEKSASESPSKSATDWNTYVKQLPVPSSFLEHEELMAVTEYCSDDAYYLNKRLRGGEAVVLPDFLSGMNKLASHGYVYVGETFRGISGDIHNPPANWFNVGEIFRDKGCLSTSLNIDEAKARNQPENHEASEAAGVLIHIFGKSGVDVIRLSPFKTESEILFRPNIDFLVTKKIYNKETNTYIVTMQEV